MRVRLKQGRLQELVAASRLSQNAWAMRVGVSRGHWSDIVNGKHPYPSARTRQQMLEALGVPFEDLFEIDAGGGAASAARLSASLGDRYVLDRELGEGAMGVVHLSRDTRFGRQVAIKFVSAEATGDFGAARFLAEVHRMARLQHPNVLPLLDAGDAGGQPYYVMPYVAGGSLRARLESEGRLGLETAVRILSGMAAALSHAHDRGLLHCDIKPENVLLDGDHPYVSDFGLSRALHLEVLREWQHKPELDTAAGTPGYVSPEQARAEADLDARSDVYSLACVLFEMLAGRAPFAGGTTTEVVQRRFDAVPPDLRRHAPEVPEPVVGVIEAALSVDREARPATPAQLVQRLQLAVAAARAGSGNGAVVSVSGSVASAIGGWAAARPPRRRGLLMASILEDLRYSFRSLMRKPMFAVIATITMALGIGANAAIFSVINAAIIQPLPYAEPDDLVRVYSTYEGRLCCTVSAPNFRDLRARVSQFEDLVAYGFEVLVVTGGSEPVRLSGYRVSSGLFEMLGAQPQIGRFFSREDDTFGAEPVVVLSDRLWRDRYDADPAVLGRSVTLDSVPHTVIGVAPPDFRVSGRPLLFVPQAWDPENMPSRGSNYLVVLGRVADGATVQAATSELSTAYAELVAQYPDQITNKGVATLPLHEWLVGAERTRPLLMLWGAVGMVLLVACVNVVNLMLARAESRQQELAVRSALGAGRARLIRHFLGESLLVALVGGAVGVGAAYAGLALLLSTYGGAVPRSEAVGIDTTVLGFAVLLSLATGLFVGLVPALFLRPDGLRAALAEGGRGSAGGQSSLRKGLVVLEVAAALVLVVGAGLLLKSFWRLNQVDVGVQANRLLTARVSLPQARYPEQSDIRGFFEPFRERVSQLPGVEAAGLSSAAPFSDTWSNFSRISPIGNPDLAATFVEARSADSEYFVALGVPFLRGRNFESIDGPDNPDVVIVNQELVRQLFPEADPIGAFIGPDPAGDGWEIVGVVDDVFDHGPDQAVPPMVYFSATQDLRSVMSLTVRTTGDPLQIVPALRQVAATLDPELPVFGIERLDRMISDGLAGQRFTISLLTIFAAIALTLGAIGIYGVMAYVVERRTREIGLRQALGATPSRLLGGVVLDGMRLAGVGIGLGIVGAYLLRQTLGSLLFEVSAFDPSTYLAVAALLALVAATACLVPARRAAGIDPMEALREE